MNYNFEKDINHPQQYYWFKQALTKEEVEKVFELVSPLAEEGGGIGGNKHQTMNGKVRTSTIKWIPKTKKYYWIYERLMGLATEANNALWRFDLHSADEQIQYTEYHATEEGHYNWHQDILDGPQGSRRKVSITIQLSNTDEYKEGDLLISTGGSDMNRSIKCPRGSGVGVLFPSYMMHKVSRVTEGTRKSLVLWVGGDHYR